MKKIIYGNKFKKMFSYILFVFAFVCVGFISNNCKVEAKNEIESITYFGDSVEFTYFYNREIDKEIEYWVYVGKDDSYSEAGKGVVEYTDCSVENKNLGKLLTCSIDISSYSFAKENKDNITRTFKVKVFVSSKWMGIESKGELTSELFTYTKEAPKVDGVSVSYFENKKSIGSKIVLTVKFNNKVVVGSGVTASFKLGVVDKTASCSKGGSDDSMTCAYTIVEGDSGKISGVTINGTNNIRGWYGNYIGTDTNNKINCESFNDYVGTVDGIKPVISSISTTPGVYSNVSETPIVVFVKFSEDISGGAPALEVVFDNKNDVLECELENVIGATVSYTCVVKEAHSGTMEFKRISGGSLVDAAGNSVILDVGEGVVDASSFLAVKVNPNNPSLKSDYPIVVPVINGENGCEISDNNRYYCETGDQIKIEFEFDDENGSYIYNDSKTTVTIGFGKDEDSFKESALLYRCKANETDVGFDCSGSKLIVIYEIKDDDNGKLMFSYNLTFKGENGKEGIVANSLTKEFYVDNAVPEITFEEVAIEEESGVILDHVIYTAESKVVSFVYSVSDASEVFFDSSKVSVLSLNNVAVEIGEGKPVESIDYDFDSVSGVLKVFLTVGKLSTVTETGIKDNIGYFKIKLDSGAIRDEFNKLNIKMETSIYTFDTNAPTFNVEVTYPEYKGYNTSSGWLLISGNVVDFAFTGSNFDVDLKDYCIVSNGVCDYVSMESGVRYAYEVSNIVAKNTFEVKVRDKALNESTQILSFDYFEMFVYEFGAGSVARNHTITVDVSKFAVGDRFKYSWFNKESVEKYGLNFDDANVMRKQIEDGNEINQLSFKGSNEYNGDYMLCIYKEVDSVTLCSDYVEFDNKIDYFDVYVSNDWTSEDIGVKVAFSDKYEIKCLAIGKNYSNLNCNIKDNPNVRIVKSYQAQSPFTDYLISENGMYYFYIEDINGNSEIFSQQVTGIDREKIVVELFNGDYGDEYNSNLELGSYKQGHNFLAVFDRTSGVDSYKTHAYYKYFFATSEFMINNIDDFNSYYVLSSYNKGGISAPSINSNKLYITTPVESNIYYLYIAACDKAGHVTIFEVKDIKVDGEGPTIEVYDSENNLQTSIGSPTEFISSFEYSFIITDEDSKLDLNKIYYNWRNSANQNVFDGEGIKYELCPFSYTSCKIYGSNIELEQGKFDPRDSYKFVLTVYDNAGNKNSFISEAFKIDRENPTITTSVDEDKWYNSLDNNFKISVSKENNNTSSLTHVAYCLNDCNSDGVYDLSKFTNLVVSDVGASKVEKDVSFNLVNGVNVLYVYAADAFGNNSYEEYIINYDAGNPFIEIDEEINLSSGEEQRIEFIVSDSVSGVKQYCVYQNMEDKQCYSLNGSKSESVNYLISESGTYYIEVRDLADNSSIATVSVTGIDNEPILFDLVSSVRDGKFTNGNVVISLINIKDSTLEDVTGSIKFIDYVVLPCDSRFDNYGELFESDFINLYTVGEGDLVTSFTVNTNNLYVVRVVDNANNVNYNQINIKCIDKDSPVIDVNTYSNGKDRIYLYGKNGNVNKDMSTGVYDYLNDTLMVYVGEDSLRDKYTGYNGSLKFNICFKFENSECSYDSYIVQTKLNSNNDYVINKAVEITAPYDFNGVIYYYVVDGAGNSSDIKSFVVNYTSDENSPLISYSTKSNGNYSSYKVIYNEIYVSGSIKLKFEDADLNYFEVYSNSDLETRCYVSSVVDDVNCIKHMVGEIGFAVENGVVYYYLNSGDRTIKAYDIASNVKEVNVYTDDGKPIINVYKKVGEVYSLQSMDTEFIFNSLEDLYIKVHESTFSYVNVDLYNSDTGELVVSASRYSYIHETSKCLYDSSVCEYGAAINDLLVMSTLGFNQIIITVYDKASNYSVMVISYDVEVPEILVVDDGANIYMKKFPYTIEENTTVKVQIGANDGLTLDDLLNALVKSVDGYKYNEIKNNNLFKVTVYRDDSVYSEDMFASIGSYKIELSYADKAGNVASSKYINVIVEDRVRPIGAVLDSNGNSVEIKEIVVINGIDVTDNYGLEISNGSIIKRKTYGLNNSKCSLVSNEGTVSCSGKIDMLSATQYRFIVAGAYTFTYNVEDLAGNSVQVIQTLYVVDSTSPVMSSDTQGVTIEVGERNSDQTVNIGEVVVKYPVSYDYGDELHRTVSYAGLYSVNSMKQQYKVVNDTYLVSDDGEYVTYQFNKVGVYYLKFTSSDKSGNVSIFDYEVQIIDNEAPVISGVSDGQIIEIEMGETVDVNDLISTYSISAKDNYSDNVKVIYDIKEGSEHTYEVVFTSSDDSKNEVNVVVYIDIVDTVKPTVGELDIVEATNSKNIAFKVTGGSDNSNKFYHEYSVQNGEWIKYDENSVIELGDNLSTTIRVCVRTVDNSLNISDSVSCRDIFVDTKKPVISGAVEGSIYKDSVTINVTDDKLESVEVTLNNQRLEINKDQLPVTLSDIGSYGIVARDELGNQTTVNFIINVDAYMNVVNDVNASEYTTTSIEFDKRFLVKADVEYDNNGDSNIAIKLDHISLKEKDMIYVLGIVPETASTFVMFSASSDNVVNYEDGVTLLSYGNSFKYGVKNEDCLVKINDDYYVYLIIKENVDSTPIIVEDEVENEKDDSLKTVLIVIGSLIVLLIGYQVFKLRKRVRAA